MKTRHLFWQLPLVFLVTMPLWWKFAAKVLDPHGKIAVVDVIAEKKITMDGVILTQVRAGKTELILHADHIDSQKNQEIFYLQRVAAKLFKGDKTINVTSSEAIYNNSQQVVTLLDNVYLTDSDSLELETSVLRFLTKYNKIKSAAPFKATSGKMKVSGTSFYYDLVSGDFRVGKRVRCTL